MREIFSSISPTPVAAASLGQVYKARLADTDVDVAVKVQRPDVVEQIALDVYLLRKLAGFVRKWKKINSNLPLLIDEWATSLFKEVDYERFHNLAFLFDPGFPGRLQMVRSLSSSLDT